MTLSEHAVSTDMSWDITSSYNWMTEHNASGICSVSIYCLHTLICSWCYWWCSLSKATFHFSFMRLTITCTGFWCVDIGEMQIEWLRGKHRIQSRVNKDMPLTAILIAFQLSICPTAFWAYTNSSTSCKPVPALMWPILPRKLISVWNPLDQYNFDKYSVRIETSGPLIMNT